MAKTEFKVLSTSAIVVTGHNVTHYLVGEAMLASGQLVDNGFHQVGGNDNHTIVLIPRDGVDSAELQELLERTIEDVLVG